MTQTHGIPASADSSLAAAWVCFDEGRLEDAMRLARQSLQQAPRGRPHAHAALGWFLLSAGSVAEAEALLVSSLGRHPEHAPLHWYLGLLHLHEHRPDEARQALLAAVTFDPQLDEAAVSLAWVLADLGRFDEAAHYSAQALAIKVQPDRLAQLGWLLLVQEAWEDATKPLTQALLLEPDRIDTRCHLSTALQRLGRQDEALGVLTSGLLLTPDAAALLQQQTRLLLDLHRTEEARSACHRLLRQAAKDGMGWYLLSLVLVQYKRLGLASHALRRARRLAPLLPELWLQTGWLALETNDLRTARDAVARLLHLAPEHATTDILAAVVLEKSDNLQAATEHAEKAVALAAGSADAWRALAQVRARQNHSDEARDALHTALRLEPDNTSVTYSQLGWICVSDRQYQDAIAAFTAAIENNAQDATAWYGLAEASRAAKQSTEALHAIRQALDLRHDWPDALQLRRRILGEQIDGSMKQVLLNFHTARQQSPPPQPDPQDAQHAATQGAQYEYALCSFCTLSHLPLLRTMAASARKHFSGKIYLLLIDSDDATLIPEGATPVRMRDVIDASVWQEMLGRYNILELCCTLKPFLMRYVARATGCPVVYLDADTYVLESLNPSLPQTRDFSVFLTPHLLMPFTGERHVEEIGALRIGIYNAGLVGVGMDADALRFLDWWADRVSRYAYDAPEHGVFTDQKWIDLVPSFFRNVQTSRDWGLNVGPWRVRAEQDFAEDPAGRLTFCGALVRLMHVSRFNPDKPDMLTSYLPHAQTTDSALGRFLRRYALAVIHNRRPAE